LGFNVCFAAETPMRTATGSVRADDVRQGMYLLSRDEYNPEGTVEVKLVEEIFVREGLICLLKAMGQTVRSTNEHPFFVKGKGWTPLNQIHAGDSIWTEASGWVTVDAVEETGQWETVYNFRIAQHHTYFVGGDDWGFSLWAHNACTLAQAQRIFGPQGHGMSKSVIKKASKLANEGSMRELRAFLRYSGFGHADEILLTRRLLVQARAVPQPTVASVLRTAGLPTRSHWRYVPPKGWSPTQPLPKGGQNGYLDKWDNEWTRGPSRTKGEAFEWDVQLSKHATKDFVARSPDGAHVNVSLKGVITH